MNRALRVVASLAFAACSSSSNGAGSTNDGGGQGDGAAPTSDGGGQTSEASASGGDGGAKDPETAPVVSVDRFSDAFAHLFKRSANASFPAANAPIDCDQGPFITHGLGPNGEKVAYYNFDVLPTKPAPIYVLFAGGTQVAGQLNVVDVLPGDPGYNDFWLITKVAVPSDYIANSVTSLAEIIAAGFATTPTNMLVNCPVVPAGSTAKLRYTSEPSALQRGWYRDKIVNYFSFDEHALMTATGGTVPTAPILVAFNIDPDPNNAMSGPPSGFVTEMGSMQTHNVISVLPTDSSYSPLWSVSAYKSASFAAVSNWMTAFQAPIAAANLANVNCPVVAVSSGEDGGVDAAGE
jgi:hypothetical protein